MDTHNGDAPAKSHRAAVYSLLGHIWGAELNADVISVLSKPEAARAWALLGGPNPENLSSQSEQLDEDYCRLLIGPTGHISPIKSVWSEDTLQADTIAELQEFASIIGYTSPWKDMLSDHLANCLMMMSLMLRQSAAEQEHKQVIDDITTTFFDRHVQWGLRFFQKIAEVDGGGFYGRTAGVSLEFLREEKHESAMHLAT